MLGYLKARVGERSTYYGVRAMFIGGASFAAGCAFPEFAVAELAIQTGTLLFGAGCVGWLMPDAGK
jgi:hypothetical protein